MNRVKASISSYLIALVSFLALDFVWLSFANPRLYQPLLTFHLAAKPHWGAVCLFYPLYVAGIVFFAVRPLEPVRPQLRVSVGRGIMLGIVAYGTYDLTNQATLTDWPWTLTIIDMCWGGLASGVATLMTCKVTPALRAPHPGPS